MSKKRVIMISSILFIISLFILYLYITPIIILKGGNININLGEAYKEPGYKIIKNVFFKEKMIIENKINPNKTGTYKIIYKVIKNGKTKQKTRLVTVLDKVAPEIILKGANPAHVCPGKQYIEEGFIANDNSDGDLTSKVKQKQEKNTIFYSATDQSGNKGLVKRKLKYSDEEKPVITLNGDSVSVYFGNSYEEPGFTAVDNCDGDLTDKVKINGSINTSQIGDYKLVYEVSDEAGNTTQITRTVTVLPKTNKIIYLTFDDGPSADITPKLLNILKEENVKATFFVLDHGENLDYLIKREYEEGHTVALHSSTHNYKQIYRSPSDFFADLYAIQGKVKNITGVNPTLMRFPGGSSNTVSRFNPGIMSYLTKEVTKQGFHYFDWNVDSEDAGKAQNENDVYTNVVNHLKSDYNIVLMHDYKGNQKTLNAIRKIIEYGKKNGYKFGKITMDTPAIHHRIVN